MGDFDRLKRKRLGDILVDEGIVAKEAVISAMHEQQRTRRLLSDILLESQAVSEFDLARVLVDQYQLPFVDLAGYSFHKDLVQAFPAQVLHDGAVIPLDRFGSMVVFACQEVPPQEIGEKLRRYAPGGMHFFVALSAEIRRCLGELVPAAEKKTATKEEDAPTFKVPLGEDTAWKQLFDTADKEVLEEAKTVKEED